MPEIGVGTASASRQAFSARGGTLGSVKYLGPSGRNKYREGKELENVRDILLVRAAHLRNCSDSIAGETVLTRMPFCKILAQADNFDQPQCLYYFDRKNSPGNH